MLVGSINVFVGLLVVSGILAVSLGVSSGILYTWRAHHYSWFAAAGLALFITLSYIFGGESCQEP